MRIELRSNAKAIADRVALDSDEFRTATMRSLNRAADGLRTDASREIRKEYQIKAKDLTPAFATKKASKADLVAVVSASGRPLALYAFGARQVKSGVSVAVRKGTRKVLRRAFIARMPSGHIGVFMRDGSKRLPISEKYTVSIPGMFGAKAVAEALQGLVADRFEKAMQQNVAYLTRR
jgi:hypothetical protein